MPAPGNHRYHKSRCILNTRAAKRASSHWGLILIHYLQLIGSFWKLHKHLFNMAFPDSPPPVLPSPSPRCHTVHFSSELERDHHGQDRMLPYFHFSRPPLLIEAWCGVIHYNCEVGRGRTPHLYIPLRSAGMGGRIRSQDITWPELAGHWLKMYKCCSKLDFMTYKEKLSQA